MRIPVLAVFAVLASCAPVADSSVAGAATTNASRCFNVNQVTNFRQGRADQLFIRVFRSDVYELNTAGGCIDLGSATQLALIPDGGMAATRLCVDDWARVVVPGSSSNVCRVQVSRSLTAEEVAALPAAHNP